MGNGAPNNPLNQFAGTPSGAAEPSLAPMQMLFGMAGGESSPQIQQQMQNNLQPQMYSLGSVLQAESPTQPGPVMPQPVSSPPAEPTTNPYTPGTMQWFDWYQSHGQSVFGQPLYGPLFAPPNQQPPPTQAQAQTGALTGQSALTGNPLGTTNSGSTLANPNFQSLSSPVGQQNQTTPFANSIVSALRGGQSAQNFANPSASFTNLFGQGNG